jgi:hypothetical protein
MCLKIRETWGRVQALEGVIRVNALAAKPTKARTGLRHTERLTKMVGRWMDGRWMKFNG